VTGFRHQAVLYEGTTDFLASTLPFVRDAVAAGDPLIVVAHTQNLAALREAVVDGRSEVEWVDSRDWYHSPGIAFSGFVNFALDRPDANCVRIIGEPIWPLAWDAAVAEYAHYESVFNVIGESAPIWALCPYNIRQLPDSILEHAHATHPEVWTGGGLDPSQSFVDPHLYCSHLADRIGTPDIRVRRLPLTADLAAARAAVAAEAVAAGVRPSRIQELLLAAHEVAANALTHGGGYASLRTWSEEHSFVCEIEDHGPGLSETVAGYLPPTGGQERGRGMWLARQLCDLVEVQSRSGTTRVRLHVRRG